MSFLILLVIFLSSFIQTEYVLYKYDGTELTEQEHRQAYQILLEQQWPTAPAFNPNYNPKLDEEVEITKRLKAEVPTVYAQWIPIIAYELLANEGLKTIVTQESVSKDIYKNIVDDELILKCGQEINLIPFFISLHKKCNDYLSSVLQNSPLNYKNNELIPYYYQIILEKTGLENRIATISHRKDLMPTAHEYQNIIVKILMLEQKCKLQPDLFLLYRSGAFLPSRDFSVQQLKNLKNDLLSLNVGKIPKIRSEHLYNISYGASFFGAIGLDSSASPAYYFFNDLERMYGYVLPIKKSSVLNGEQFFGVSPLTTFISSFFCRGELFHSRAFTLLTDEMTVRQDIEDAFWQWMAGNEDWIEAKQEDWNCIKGDKTWYQYFTEDHLVSQFVFKLNSACQVVKQAALRRQSIVKNAIPLNDATKKLIDNAREMYT